MAAIVSYPLLLIFAALFHSTTATYCYGTLDYYCDDDQYCCGTISCCNYANPVYSIWWFWLVICLAISAICSCIGCCVRARRRRMYLENAQARRAVTGIGAPRYGAEVTVTVPPPISTAPPAYATAVYGYNQPTNYNQAPSVPSYQQATAQPVKN